MKKYFLLTILLVIALSPISAQFVSEADVLSYLDNKTFVNQEVKGTLQFAEKGSNLLIDKRENYAQPGTTILSEKTALVNYYNTADLSQKVSYIVDTEKNEVLDRGTKKAYLLQSSDNDIISEGGSSKFTPVEEPDKGKQQNPYPAIGAENVYCIQIAASKSYIDPAYFKELYKLEEAVYVFKKAGWYKYVVTRTETADEARLRLHPYGDKAFVVLVDQSTLKTK